MRRPTSRLRRTMYIFRWKWLIVVAFLMDVYYHALRINHDHDHDHDHAVTFSTTSIIINNNNNNRNYHAFMNPAQYSALSQNSNLPRLVIMGTVRNIQPHLAKIEKTLVRLLQHQFQLMGMIFFENNSTDNTVQELERWSLTQGWNVTVLSQDDLREPQRTVRLAYGRNRLWRDLLSHDKIDYVLMMDMDDVNWHLAHANACFQLPTNWSVCCVNSYKVYYDLWALRTMDDWMPCDNYQTCSLPLGKRKPFRHIPASHEPIRVQSCFGGAALYKYYHVQKLLRTQSHHSLQLYTGLGSNGEPICEHLSFHRALAEHTNTSLYIQPKFLNDGPSDERMLYFGSIKKRFEPDYLKSWKDYPEYYDAINNNST